MAPGAPWRSDHLRTCADLVYPRRRWEEDKAGLAFVGRSGTEYLWPELEKHGIKREDVSITNTAACAPNYKKIDDKTKIEKLILKCPWVPEEIKKLKSHSGDADEAN